MHPVQSAKQAYPSLQVPHSALGMVCDSQESRAPNGLIRTTAISHAKLPGLCKSHSGDQRSLRVLNDTSENAGREIAWETCSWQPFYPLVSIFSYEFTMHFWSTANFLQLFIHLLWSALLNIYYFKSFSWLELLPLHSGTPCKSQTKLQTALRNRQLCLKGN